jgi:predicted DNA-binding protein
MTETPNGGVRNLAVRLTDELRAQLDLMAQLDGTSVAEVIRTAIEDAIARRRDTGQLASQAQAALDAIDREAAARRSALQALLGPTGSGKRAASAKAAPAKATARQP